jgi:coenzyme Q-binding protein COQ10
MPKFETTRRVKHSADKMFALVADIRKYPEFVPMCEALTVRDTRERDGQTLLTADMSVGYKAIRETFTSQVHLKPADNQIRARYLDGPFKSLDNLWTFVPVSENASDVKFFIEYEFKNAMLGMLMGVMFDRAFRHFAQAFEERADEIYATNSKV